MLYLLYGAECSTFHTIIIHSHLLIFTRTVYHDTEFDWRNTDVYHIITNGAFTNIHLMPFRDITLPLYNMHPSSSVVSARHHEDCTHYCYFPQMWQTIWFHLYEAAFGPQTPIDYSFAAEAERRRLRKG